MLLVFEGVLANQRLLNLQMLRAMRKDPFLLYVYRFGKWELQVSDKLVPGDIISLTSNSILSSSSINYNLKQKKNLEVNKNIQRSVEKYVPCDAIIIRVNCLVNEALLTGNYIYFIFINFLRILINCN